MLRTVHHFPLRSLPDCPKVSKGNTQTISINLSWKLVRNTNYGSVLRAQQVLRWGREIPVPSEAWKLVSSDPGASG